ncbi:hypothetical protein DESPIG_00644 [Desulfovibrio piger ATCC 29098]|uniref:Uncharacterized protein n=1 Tax=Desulfovibrio piger ATCC 29098 TaxID=411464 RepID=B6WRF4_9BACT|nr:hypothetical protein DESPIG_00644 [Desulfovibrio piger ATCC 29098]
MSSMIIFHILVENKHIQYIHLIFQTYPALHPVCAAKHMLACPCHFYVLVEICLPQQVIFPCFVMPLA